MLTLSKMGEGKEHINEVARKGSIVLPGGSFSRRVPSSKGKWSFLSVTSNPSRSQLDPIFLTLPRKPFGAG